MSAKILPKGAAPPSLRPWLPAAEEHPEEQAPVVSVKAEVPAVSGPSPVELELLRLQMQYEEDVEAARQSGFQTGQAQAQQELQERYQVALTKLARTMEEVSSSRARFRREAEEDVVRLSLAIARRILHREITIDPQSLQGLIKAALAQVEAREITQVRAHPTLLADLRQQQEQIGPSGTWNWTPDPTLAIGDVWIDTARGQLDASIETQLEEIERGFADYLPVKA